MNTLKTLFLMGVLSAMIVALGSYFGGERGLMMAFGVALVTNFASYWFSDKMALSMSGAVPVSREDAPQLYAIVDGLADKANIPTPNVYIIPTESPNAFATGRDPAHSSIAVTKGIMRILNPTELEAVLAHELGHVRNRDILLASIAAVLASVVTYIAHWGMYLGGDRDNDRGGGNAIFGLLLMILAPIAAALINLAISRSREYQADATGAEICGHPEALASALAKLEYGSANIPMQTNPALSSLYIVKPDQNNWFVSLMSTHPPIPERIKRLEAMAHNHRDEAL
jgi:heat shock protein HtpX